MGFETYVLSVDGSPVGAYSELPNAQSEASERESSAYPAIPFQWVVGGDHDRWVSGRYAISRFMTNTGLDNPFTGDLVIAINDAQGPPLAACAGVVGEILARLSVTDFQRLQFSFGLEHHPSITVSGPDEILNRVLSYTFEASGLGAEWCQV